MILLAPTTADTHHSSTADFSLRFPSTCPVTRNQPRSGVLFLHEVGSGEG
jgi:hypothetical protein